MFCLQNNLETYSRKLNLKFNFDQFIQNKNIKINTKLKLMIQQVKTIKTQGNDYFKQQKFPQAIEIFKQAIDLIENSQAKQFLNAQSQISKEYVNILNNVSFASLNTKTQKGYADARKYATNALSVDKNNLKALYRRGMAIKQYAQSLEREQGQQCKGLLQLYQQAKEDFQKLNLLDRSNELAKQKFSETVKDIYRIRKATNFEQNKPKKKQEQVQKEEQQNEVKVSYPKPVAKKNSDMNRILKEYKVQQVTQIAQSKVQKEYLTNKLPRTRAQLQKAIRTIKKNEQVFLQFVQRIDGGYLKEINPTFDMMSQLMDVIIKKGQGEKSKQFMAQSKEAKCFELLWKSYIGKEKKAFKEKWVALGLPEEEIANLK